VKINAKYVSPFIEAAVNVIKQIADIEVRRGHLSYKNQPEPSHSVSIIIGVYGFLTGQVVYSMKSEVSEKLVAQMLQGKSPQEQKILYVDTLGELANMITGNATAILNTRKDMELHITTPAIASGENLSINLVPQPTIVLGLYCQYGPVEVSVALEEKAQLNELDEITGEHALSEV